MANNAQAERAGSIGRGGVALSPGARFFSSVGAKRLRNSDGLWVSQLRRTTGATVAVEIVGAILRQIANRGRVCSIVPACLGRYRITGQGERPLVRIAGSNRALLAAMIGPVEGITGAHMKVVGANVVLFVRHIRLLVSAIWQTPTHERFYFCRISS